MGRYNVRPSMTCERSTTHIGSHPEILTQLLAHDEQFEAIMLRILDGVWNAWGPWPPESTSGNQVQPTQKYNVQPANRGDNPWTDWAREVSSRAPSSNKRHASAGGAYAWGQKWDSYQSDWSRPYQWSAPKRNSLAGSDYDTDREWHAGRMRFNSGWANDPT